MYKIMNLRRFEEGGNNGGNAGGNGGQGNAGSNNSFNYEQVEQIANERANRASAAAVRSYFQQQGMSQADAEAAMTAWRQQRQQNSPEAQNAILKQQLAEAQGKLKASENMTTLKKLGVSDEYADYVAYQVSKNVKDGKDFETAAKEFLGNNAKYKQQTGTYRVTTGTSGSQGTGTASKNESINAAIRSAVGR